MEGPGSGGSDGRRRTGDLDPDLDSLRSCLLFVSSVVTRSSSSISFCNWIASASSSKIFAWCDKMEELGSGDPEIQGDAGDLDLGSIRARLWGGSDGRVLGPGDAVDMVPCRFFGGKPPSRAFTDISSTSESDESSSRTKTGDMYVPDAGTTLSKSCRIKGSASALPLPLFFRSTGDTMMISSSLSESSMGSIERVVVVRVKLVWE